jgi:hypothetical protein
VTTRFLFKQPFQGVECREIEPLPARFVTGIQARSLGNCGDILPTPHLTVTAGASFLHRLGFLLHGSLSILSFLHRLLDDLPDRCKSSFKD